MNDDRPRRILILGGTTEARRLAEALVAGGDLDVVTSLAGRTSRPAPLPGRMRVGGFGGTDGLVEYLTGEGIDAVVDATHPFAAVMPWHAADACTRTGTPRLRLERPGWVPIPGDRWTAVPDLAAAAAAVASSPAARVFLTVGRTDLAAFTAGSDGRRWWLVRSVDAPEPLPVAPAEVVLDRGPFSLDAEIDLLRRHRIDLIVTKNSGGDATSAKLAAARRLGIEVLVVDRPPSPDGPAAPTVAAALTWLDSVPGPSR